jgi:cytochrome P450
VFDDLIDHMQHWLLVATPERHGRLRKLMNRGFSPAVIERLTPRVAAVVDQLIGSISNGGEVDLINEYAYPLPVHVISMLLGVPESLRARMVQLSNDVAMWFGSVTKTPENSAVAQEAIRELVAHFADLIRRRGGHDGDDLMSLLLAASADDSVGMSDAELHAQCVMLLFAGHETTRNLIGNGLYTLLRNPVELGALRRNPELIGGVIEETLRYESPVQSLSRTVTEAINIDGTTLPVGASLAFMIAAAQRDERQYSEPDTFNIRRTHVRHLAFGGDAHVCLGSTLARLEGRLAMEALIRRFPEIELVDPSPSWSRIFILRGLTKLPVVCRPSRH